MSPHFMIAFSGANCSSRASLRNALPKGAANAGPFRWLRQPSSSHNRHPVTPAAGGFFGGLFGSDRGAKDQGKGQGAAPSAASTLAAFPPYSIIQKGSVYDLRLYEVYPVVEVQYQRRDEGYLALGTYFDGQNTAGAKFQETQPVVMRYHGEGKKAMQLYVGGRRGASSSDAPLSASLADLPAPSNRDVQLRVAGGEVLAVLKFEGNITPESAEAARTALLAALDKDGLQLADEEASGMFRVAQYGPLFSLSTRVNEMLLRVKL